MFEINYQEFRTLCRVKENNEWAPGFIVKPDGVWIDQSVFSTDIILDTEEHNTLMEHPNGDYSKPVLSLPCRIKDLQVFLENSGLYGCIDAFDMADFVEKKMKKNNLGDEIKKGGQKEINSLLRMIMGMAKDCYGYDPTVKKGTVTSDIVKAVSAIGLTIDDGTVLKWLKEGAEILP